MFNLPHMRETFTGENQMSDLLKAQQTIEAEKKNLSRMEALARLRNNVDFIEIIGKGYLQEHAAYAIRSSVDTRFSAEDRQALIDKARAVGWFDEYMDEIDRRGSMAHNTIKANEEYILQLKSEGV